MSKLTNKIQHLDETGVLEAILGGANLDKQDKNKNTPLHLAAKVNAVEICCLLLQHGAKTDTKNAQGITADQYETEAAKHILVHKLNTTLNEKGYRCKKVKI